MKTFSEEELIAYHLGELSWWKQRLLRHRLEVDADLATESEEIAATLRAFSSDPAPVASEALLERSWNRVRRSLSVLDTPPRSRPAWMWAAVSVSAVTVIAIAAVIEIPRIHTVQVPAEAAANGVSPPRNWSQRLLGELRRDKPDAEPYNHRSGPLTTAPVDAVAEDPALAAHLDTAERVLTEVSHADGPLQPETREQVHRLLLENAVYHQSAEQHGDMETAAVIDDLGRVLISLDAEPLNVEKEHTANPYAFRLEMNLGGVLLDLRILHHNGSPNEDR
jgi:hypothetical protein